VRGDNIVTTVDELLFFDAHQDALPLYEAFGEAVLGKVPDARIEVKKTQISFFDRRMFAAVSFTPVRKAKERPKPFLTITFGLPYRKESDRIDVAVEAYPNRWTHHVMIGSAEEVDEELVSWIIEADEFAKNKKR
jgi:hypothetical protein